MILIIDDDSAVRSSLSFMLKRAGYEAQTVPGPREAMDVVRAEAPALILMDMNFNLSTTGEEGLTLLKQVKIFRPDVPVILMTAWGSIQLAVQGMQAGAFDFITKPWNNAALLQRIETALELTAVPKDVPEEQSETLNRSHIIGKSQGLMGVLNTVARIARTNASVLITGESGTGKELIAEAIHINSQRVKQPFVKVNLGGISQSLFASPRLNLAGVPPPHLSALRFSSDDRHAAGYLNSWPGLHSGLYSDRQYDSGFGVFRHS